MRVILRLLDAANSLLGWAECTAAPREPGALWLTSVPAIVVEREGVAAALVGHLPDLDVRFRVPVLYPPGVVLPVGTVVTGALGGPIVTIPSDSTVVLPAVTVGRRIVSVPAGNLMSIGG